MLGKKTIGLFVVFLGLVGSVLAHGDEDSSFYTHHGMMGGGYGYFPMVLGWTTALLFIVVLFLLIVWLIKQIQKS